MPALLVFLIILVIVFVVAYENLSFICSKVVDFLLPNDAESDTRCQLKTLKDELNSVSMVNEFAKYARLERRINKMTDSLRVASKSRTELMLKTKFAVTVVYYMLQVLSFILMLYMYRHEAVLQLPEEWFYPFSSVIAFPSGIPGGVGITVWILVCRSVVSQTFPPLIRYFRQTQIA